MNSPTIIIIDERLKYSRFPKCLISKKDIMECPERSPDITPLYGEIQKMEKEDDPNFRNMENEQLRR